MSKIKTLSFWIEVNRQRLEHAIRVNDESLRTRTLFLLVTLESEFVNEIKKGLNMDQKTTHVLVFSDENTDGRVMTLSEYRSWCRERIKTDPKDFQSHLVTEIAEGMADATEQALFQVSEIERKNKAG